MGESTLFSAGRAAVFCFLTGGARASVITGGAGTSVIFSIFSDVFANCLQAIESCKYVVAVSIG